LRPLPYADPDRLVTTRGSLADLRDLDAANQSFEGMAFWASNLYNLRVDADTRQVMAGQVTRNLFPLLGVQPLLGRNFTLDDERGRHLRGSAALRAAGGQCAARFAHPARNRRAAAADRVCQRREPDACASHRA